MNLDLVFAYPYAFLASLAVAVACSLLSPFVVYKRMAFIGEGVAHAGIGGIGLAFLAGIWIPQVTQPGWTDVVIALACVATALAIGRLTAVAGIEADAAIGVGLVVAMSVGIASLDLYSYLRPEAYRPGVHDVLFGDPFTAEAGAFAWASLVALATVALVTVGYRPLVFYAFDEEGALLFGMPVRAVRYIFLFIMALAVVAAIRLVGVILVTGLLVMPGLVGRALARGFAGTLGWSLASGVGGTLGGMLLVVSLGYFSSGPIVVLVLALLLALALVIREAGARRRRRMARA